jgi:hypothetical protein
VIAGPPPVVGEHGLEILQSLASTDPEALIANEVILQHRTTESHE